MFRLPSMTTITSIKQFSFFINELFYLGINLQPGTNYERFDKISINFCHMSLSPY